MSTSTFKPLKGETSTHVPVQRFVDDYCTAITENFKRYSIRQYESMVIRDEGSRYAQDRLEEIKQGTANLTRFRYYSGKKYYKICLLYTSPSPRDVSLSRMPSSA